MDSSELPADVRTALHPMTTTEQERERAWWDDYDLPPAEPLMTMQIEAPEQFQHQCGFVKLRERHRVKAKSRRI